MSVRKENEGEPFWSQAFELKNAHWNEAHFNFLPNQLSSQQSYVVRITTKGIDAPSGLRLSYEYGEDSSYPEGTVSIYGSKEGAWQKTNEQSGNVALSFYSDPPLGARIGLAFRGFFLPALIVILMGWVNFTDHAQSARKTSVISFLERDGNDNAYWAGSFYLCHIASLLFY